MFWPSRATIRQMFLLVFWENRRHHNFLIKFPDFYLINYLFNFSVLSWCTNDYTRSQKFFWTHQTVSSWTYSHSKITFEFNGWLVESQKSLYSQSLVSKEVAKSLLKSVNSNFTLAVHSPKFGQAKTHFLSHLCENEKIYMARQGFESMISRS